MTLFALGLTGATAATFGPTTRATIVDVRRTEEKGGGRAAAAAAAAAATGSCFASFLYLQHWTPRNAI